MPTRPVHQPSQRAVRAYWDTHIHDLDITTHAPGSAGFFADLERSETAQFYRHVGTLGRVLIDIETEAFALPS